MLESQITPFQTEARRSQRVVARIRVKVIRRDEAGDTFSEDTHTLAVNAHGALLMLAMKVRTGEILTLENGVGRDRTHVRVVRLGKKIESKNEVAIEFSSPLLASGTLIRIAKEFGPYPRGSCTSASQALLS